MSTLDRVHEDHEAFVYIEEMDHLRYCDALTEALNWK